MKRSFSYIVAALLVTGTLLMQSCKEDTVVRAKVAPNVAGIDVIEANTDTMTIITKSLVVDTMVTSSEFTGIFVTHVLGNMNDPYFGRTNSGFYFQVLPTANNFIFSQSAYTVDSAFVILPYAGFKWGDTTGNAKTQNMQVFEIANYVSYKYQGVTYYNNNKLDVTPTPITQSFTMEPGKMKLTDSVSVNGVNYRMHLRVPLTSTFINNFTSRVNQGDFNSEDSFLTYFKGLAVMPADLVTGNTLVYFMLDGGTDYTRGSMVFYYHNNDDPGTQKTAFFNYIRGTATHHNWIKRDYSTANAVVRNMLTNNHYEQTKNTSDSILLMQNEPGAALDIRMPYVKNLPKGIVNKAQLVITQVLLNPGIKDEDNYAPPSQMFPRVVNSDGTMSNIADLNYSSADAAFNFLDGRPTAYINLGNFAVSQYTINIPREMQKAIIENRDELHLRITGTRTLPAAYHLVAGGRTSAYYKTKLQLFYSKPQ